MAEFPWDSVKIYPPIGIARVGNSFLNYEEGWFYGPEIPGYFEEPKDGFKDLFGSVKRQAARFRVYGFAKDGTNLGEINQSAGYDLEWEVQLVNKKASWYAFMGKDDEGAFQPGFTTLRNPLVQPDKHPDERTKLIIDTGVEKIKGLNSKFIPLQGKFYGSKDTPTKVDLGKAGTDEEGRLVVLASDGLSRSIAHENDPFPTLLTDFDNTDWIDNTSDGVIRVTIKRHGSNDTSFNVPGAARVIGTTPKFANGIYAPTSLYDVIEDVYESKKRENLKESYEVGDVDWNRHIWPLIQRPPLLSWVNGQANGGHGPNAQGNFFDPGWQKSLSDNTLESEPIRRGVLGRMRLPISNSKYDQARAGQAYKYFMPWLSGDGGRATPGIPSTFTSVTELQYDRIVKWSKGEFTKDPVKKYTCFEEIPLEEQPAALTRAALEATIGSPLYPGIEMSWNAELSATYDLENPFTINPDVKPGDLTKYLSLPWQSDFYMCRNYWWPSARPDAVVTEDTYNIVSQSVVKANVAKKLNDRVPWERGLRLNYDDQNGPFYANTDMAQYWHKLGFIVERPSYGPEPIFVETQRGDIDRDGKPIQPFGKHTSLAELQDVGGPIRLPAPDSPDQPINNIKSLRTHLQTAMAIELATIPLYLYGMYSIKVPEQYKNDIRYYDPIMGAIRSVVAEEMLHLSLAGNILRAVGGKPTLYDLNYIPSFPMLMPGRVPKLWLQLRKATKANIQTYIDVENREKPGGKPEPDHYQSLGQFYQAIKDGLTYLDHEDKHLFRPSTAPYQFAPGLGYQPKVRDAGGSVVITDLKSALTAIDTIIFQGEGSPGDEYDDPDKLEKDHYDVFLDLKNGEATWDVYPVLDNPVTSDYWKLDKKIYQVSLTFDAAYCFLLRTIETLWYVDKDDTRHVLVLGNMYGIMMGVLAPLAQFLVQQPIGLNGQNAAPCFGYYEFTKGWSELGQLQLEMAAAVDAYQAVSQETRDQVPVAEVTDAVGVLTAVQSTINTLVDLGSFKKLDARDAKK